MIAEINAECKKSERLTFAKLNAVKQYNKQDHKSKLMTEKYLLLPLNSQQLTPVQTAIQRMSEKHLDFEIDLLTPFDSQRLNIHKHPRHWYQLIHHYLLSVNTFLDNQTLTKYLEILKHVLSMV